MIKAAAAGGGGGRDRVIPVIVPALMCVRVPSPTDPALLAAVLVRAISTAARPMTVELCGVPELSRAVRDGARMLTERAAGVGAHDAPAGTGTTRRPTAWAW